MTSTGRLDQAQPREHVIEELVEEAGGLVAAGELVSAEPIYLVPGKPEFAIRGDHLGITRWASAALTISVVLDAVNL